MKILEDYSFVNTELVARGYASLTFGMLRFDRYFSEEEKEKNRHEAEKLECNSAAYAAHCDAMSKEIYLQMKHIVPLFYGYDIHQLTPQTSTMEHYKSDWDLFFYSNKGWNKRDHFDYFTLSPNEKRSAADNMAMLTKIRQMLESAEVDAPNVQCIIQYGSATNTEALEAASQSIIKKNLGKLVRFYGKSGKIKQIAECTGTDSYGFFEKYAKKIFRRLDAEEVVLSGLE